MRYLIRCDMEGLTGVTTYAEVTPGEPGYEAARDRLMSDLLAVIEGLRDGDPAAEVLLYDEHVDGRNLRVELLPPGVEAIIGKPRYRADWPGGLDGSIQAMLMVGFHAMAGTEGGTLPHSYEHDIVSLEVNGKRVGEVGIEAGLAGELGIPMILYTGDSAGAREAQALLPKLKTVAVKRSLGETAARCLGAEEAALRLRQAAGAAVAAEGWPAPLELGEPVELKVSLAAGPYREAFAARQPVTEGGVVTLQGPTLAAVWADYWVRKDETLAAMAGPDR